MPGTRQFAQTRHADGVEFIQIGRRDGQKAHAFQQRHAWVHRLFQHAPVKGQPRQFAVEETVRSGRVEIRQGYGRGEGAGQKICRGGRVCHRVRITRFDVGFVTAQAHFISWRRASDDDRALGGQRKPPRLWGQPVAIHYVPRRGQSAVSWRHRGVRAGHHGAGNAPKGQNAAMALKPADQPVAAHRGGHAPIGKEHQFGARRKQRRIAVQSGSGSRPRAPSSSLAAMKRQSASCAPSMVRIADPAFRCADVAGLSACS